MSSKDCPTRRDGWVQLSTYQASFYRSCGVFVSDGLDDKLDGYWCEHWRKWVADHVLTASHGTRIMGPYLFSYLEKLTPKEFGEHMAAVASAHELGGYRGAAELANGWLNHARGENFGLG